MLLFLGIWSVGTSAPWPRPSVSCLDSSPVVEAGIVSINSKTTEFSAQGQRPRRLRDAPFSEFPPYMPSILGGRGIWLADPWMLFVSGSK